MGFLDFVHCLAAFQRENDASETASIYILRYEAGDVINHWTLMETIEYLHINFFHLTMET